MDFSEWVKKKKEEEEESSKSSQTTVSSTPSQSSSTSDPESTGSTDTTVSFSDWVRNKKATSSVQGWADASINLLTDIEKRSGSWYNQDEYESQYSQISDLLSKADSWRKEYAGNDEAISYIDSIVDALSKAQNYSWSTFRHYSQWESEDDYLKAIEKSQQAQKNRTEMLGFDLDAGAKEIGNLEALLDEYNTLARRVQGLAPSSPEAIAATNRMAEISKQFGGKGVAGIEYELTQKKAYMDQAKRLHEGVRLSSVADPASDLYDPNFATYAQKGADIANPEFEDVPGWFAFGNWNPFGEDPKNKVTYTRDNWDKFVQLSGERTASGGIRPEVYQMNDLYMEMYDNEVRLYNYYLAKDMENGTNYADVYLDSILGELEERKATGLFEPVKGDVLGELMFGVAAGVDQFQTGVEGAVNAVTGNDEYRPASAIQIASGMAREDLGNVDLKWYNAKSGEWNDADIFGSSLGQIGYDAVTTTSNMAPSILTSIAVGMVNKTAGAVVGNALLGASAAGNAYQEKLNLGYSPEQAKLYGLGVGVSEAVLQHILGGIGALGKSTLTNTVIKNLDAVDNVLARFAKSAGGKLLLSASSEAIEEGLQAVIEPYLWQAVSGEEASVDWQETMYNALLGFVTGGFFEGGEMAIENAQYRQIGKTIKSADGGVDSLMNLTNKVAGVSSAEMQKELNNLADKVSKKATSKNVGRLYDMVQNANNLANTSANQADIAKSLERKGFSSETANDIAEALVASYNGQELTKAQSKLLKSAKNSKVVQDAISNIVTNTKSTMGQRSQNIRSFSNDIALGRLAKAAGVSVDTVKKMADGKLTTVAENASETHYEVSADGKMENTKTGDVIEPQGLVQAEDGTYKIAVKDADPVSPVEVSYADNNQALVYETFVNLEKHSGKISKVIADMNLKSRNELIGLYNPKVNKDGGTFVNGVLNAYFYGHRGIDMATASKDSPMLKLTPEQRAIAWNTGRAAGTQSTTAAQSNIDTVYAEAKKILEEGKAEKESYRAVLDDGITMESMNEKQRDVYHLADQIAQGVQAKIHVYAGKNKEQGFYNHETDEIWLNLNAAKTGREHIMAFTLAHELVHRAKDGSIAKYQAFVDFLMKEYGKQGSNVESMIAEQIRAAEEFNKMVPNDQKVNMTREKALEEVVCDACQRMFLDTNAGEKLAEFGAKSKENKSFLSDLKKWISELMTKLRRYFGNVEPDSLAAKEFAKFDANVKQILADMYVDMSIDAGEKLSTIKAAYGGEFAQKFQGLKDIRYNLAAVDTHKAKLQKEFSEDSSSDLKTLMARYDKIIDIWTRLGGELNSKFLAEWNSKVGKDRTFTIFKAQAGYKYNVELSSMCKKGVPLFEAIDTIVKKEVMKELELDVLGKAEKEILYDILKQHHFEIPCAICYVEQARQREGVIIDAFLNGKVETNAKGETIKVKLGWNQVLESIEKEMKANGVNYSFAQVSRDIATEKYIPANLAMDSKTQVAFHAALKKIANQEIARYNKAAGKSRKLLTDVTPEAVNECFKGTLPANLNIFKVMFNESGSLFKIQKDLLYSSVATQNLSMAHNKLYGLFNMQGGVSGYKTKQGTTIYWGDILGKSWKPDTLRNEGGVRNQSNSDFQMYTLLDQAQMYLDFTAKGYYLQAYTKVLSELKLFGLSRGKINASLIPKVVVYRNADGSVDVEKTMATAGLDENGNPIYDDIEGINHAEAFMLIEDPEYSKNICGICIGYSDAHINKLLDDPRVQQIIGFHDKTDDGTKRYKGARYAKNYNGLNEAVNSEGKTVHIGFNPYVKRAEKKFQFNAETETYVGTIKYNGKTYTADDIPRLATDLYLEMCAKKEYTPAYKDFSGHRNYYKLLADFGLYDSQGHYAPHRKVVYNMPDTVPYLDADGKKQTMSTYDYIKAELVKELTVRDSIAEALSDTSSEGIIPQFKAAVKKSQVEKSFSLPKVFSDSIEKFGTTTDFEEAGFILPSGEMLKFTDDKHRGERQYDHRAIGMVYGIDVDLGVNHGFNKESGKFLDEFVENGGIRFDAGDPDLDMDVGLQLSSTVPITKAQEQLIRDLVKWKQNREELFEANLTEENFLYTGPLAIRIDFGGDSQYAVGAVTAKDLSAWGKKSLEYDGGNINADRIIADIRHYYQTGETRQPSLVSQFHYSYSLPKMEAIKPSAEQVKQNVQEIADMKPVHSVDASKLNKTGKRPSEIFTEYFDSWGWNIYSDGLGDIEITPQSVRDEVRHGITAVKIASVEAIPSVIQHGKIIFAGLKPGTTVYRIVICAPITIGKNPYYMGVMLQRDANTQRLYLHNVVIEEETPTISPADLLTTGANENNERLFITNILQTALNVKRQIKLDKEYMDAVNRGDMETAQRLVDEKATEVGAKLIYDPDPDGFYVLKSNIPTNWVDAYKVFNMYDGEIYPLYIKNANKTPIPFRTWVGGKEGGRKYEALNGHAYVLGDTGQSHPRSAFSDEVWQQMVDDGVVKSNAKNSPKMLAYRPGWHGTSQPFFPQGGKKDASSNYGKIHTANHVVCKVRFSKDVDLTQTAIENAPRTKDGRPNMNEADLKYLPQENGKHGSYEYRTNRGIPPEVAKKSKWYVASAMYVEAVITQAEADSLLTESGIPIQEWEGGSLDLAAIGYSQETASANPKLRDAVTCDDDGNVIPLSERFALDKNDVRYKLPIGEDTSPRALLANAFEGIITNDIEKRRLQEYKGKVEMLNSEEAKLRELRAEIKELSFAKGKRDTKRIKELQFEAMHTANRIATLDKMLLRLEAAAPLQSILKREKEMAYKRAEQKGKEALEAYRKAEKERDEQWRREVKDKYQASKKKAIETRDKREAREKLQKLVLDTVKWITYPSKTDVKCPDILKQPYADFLNGIDLSSQRLAKGGDPTQSDLRLTNAMGSLATALERVMVSQDPTQETTAVLDTGYLDLPANFVQKLRDMTEDVKAMMGNSEYVVNRMPAEEVRKLTQMIRTLNHAIKEVSTLYANLRFANVEALGDNTMSFIDELGEIEKAGGIKDFVQWNNALPYYAFKRFGKGGESIFEGLMDAQDKLAFLAQKIFDFRDKAWTEKEAKAWSEDTHTIELPNDTTLTLTTADAMSIYCLSRRQQGLQHLLGGGTRVMGIQKGSQKAKDSRSLLTIKDIEAIISSLTDRQKQVADAIQEFMSTTCSEWGNEISMKRFLTREFTEKFYFPIESNDENLATKDPSAQQSDLFRLLNISATKPIDPRANNEVIIRNIFDVFTNHASDMARLNAYGMPLLDYMKWLNYREKTVNEEGQIKVRGVRKSMELAFGSAARSYVLNLVKDINGRPSDGGLPPFFARMLRNAKTAMVGSSLRVATLQITSYPRAALVLSPKSLALGCSKLPQIKKAQKYCGIALWKSFGFYDTNISRSIEDQMKGVKDVKQKLIEWSLKGAEIGDAITWGCLWNACEYEVASTKQYKVGTEEFYQAVGKKLREVVYKTQVVDSALTRSEMMRSKNMTAQELSAFMSEPTLSANILMDAGLEFNMEKRRTGSAKSAWQKTGKYVTRSIAVYSIGQLAAALLEGFWDAWRDDDDEEFSEKFLNAFRENMILDLLPFNKMPIISDLTEMVLSLFGHGYFSSDSISKTALTQTVSAVQAWSDVLGGKSSATAYNAIYKSMRAISSFVGVSISGVMREGVTLWNNTAGAYDITWKIRTWDMSKTDLASEALDAILEGNDRQASSIRAEFPDDDSYQSAMRTAIKDRYTSGGIDYDTAIQYLIDYCGMEEDTAYWKAEEWMYESETGDDFSKYNEFFTAVETGKNLKMVIKQYTENGVAMETLATQITNHYKPLYIEMSKSEKAGIKGYLLNAFEQCGVKREDATKKLQYWEFLSEQPDTDLSQYQIADYYEFAKPAGISADLYSDYCTKVSGIEGEDKKERRMAVINSMPLTNAQKDALYFAEGWAKSKIGDAPWH